MRSYIRHQPLVLVLYFRTWYGGAGNPIVPLSWCRGNYPGGGIIVGLELSERVSY